MGLKISIGQNSLLRILLAMACWAVCSSLATAEEAFEELTIMVPAERSGGWDLTAKAMAAALRQNGEVENIKIEYSPGAGGLIGLAQFTSSKRGQGNALLVGGSFTVGSVVQNHAAVSLLDATPIARLTYDIAVVAVPANSKFKSAEDLIEAMISAPESVVWVGGSRAGVDEINLHEIARALGVPATRLHYTGLPGGGEVADALTEGRYQAGISGYSEFESRVQSGELRILAMLTDEGMAGVNAPSFSDLGIKVERLNWRGIFAAPGITQDQTDKLAGLIDRMVKSDAWRHQLREYHWLNAYLTGPEFVEFVKSETTKVAQDLKDMHAADPMGAKIIGNVLLRRYTWALALAALSVLLVFVLLYQRRKAHQREEGLQQAYERATGEAMLHTEELERALADIHAHIEQEFDSWSLTAAEKEVALLLLKGLRLKDIADARGTSERTVRQQAQAVYKKAGLEGRFELAAYFIEDVMQSMELHDEETTPAPQSE